MKRLPACLNHPQFLQPMRAVFSLIFLAMCFSPLCLVLHAGEAASGEGLVVGANGKAQAGVFALPSDNPEVAEAATILVTRLGEILGSPVANATGAWEGKGILIASKDQLPASEGKVGELLKSQPLEAYVIDINAERAVISGNSGKALKDGVYDLLEQLGCRWLIPSERWTIIPRFPDLTLPAQRTVSSPDFQNRSIWYAYGFGPDKILGEWYRTWADANRLGGVAKYKIGHTYGSTVGKHQAEFEAHPEYFAMTEEGERRPFKQHQSLCYSNPDVARFFIEDKLAELRADKAENPYAHVVSMDPNDGTDACFCESCKALGNGSDQALYLANQVAKALREEFPDAIVTMYAYASHRLPPEKVVAEPNVEIQVAMGFNRTQYTLEQLVKLWREKVAAVGIRDYFGVMAWDWGLPGRGKASRFRYVSEEIPRYKTWGARAFNTETNANWGSFGPATYVATKLLWNTKADAGAIYDDYFTKAFGKAAEDVKALYQSFSDSSELSRQNLHIWLAQLDKAFKAAEGEDAGVRERLTDLAVWLHYAVLYSRWEQALDTHDQEKAYEALKPLLEFTWQTRERNMVHAYALQRRLVNSGHPSLRPLREGWKVSDPEAIWKNPKTLTDAEALEVFRKDLESHPSDDRIVRFSAKLRPVDGEALIEETSGFLRFNTTWHVQVEKPGHLSFMLPMNGVKFDYKLRIYDMDGEEVWDSSASVTETSERYETKPFELEVKFPKPGQYTLVFEAGENYAPSFPPGLKAVLEAGPGHPVMFRMIGPLFFYVPKGTKEILVQSDGRFSVDIPGVGRKDLTTVDNDPKRGCLVIPVEGNDGKIWTMNSATSGVNYFLNIPPYLATDPSRLLVPEGVK